MDLRRIVFKARGILPVPFIVAALYWAKLSWGFLVVGFGLAAAGELLRIRAVMFAGGATRTRRVGAPGLVTTGPYGVTRNPLYLANLCIYIGFAVASSAFFPYLPVVAFLWFTTQYGLIISLEEETLYKLFGKNYTDYCRRVPRIFPRRLKGEPGEPNFTVKQALREERSTLTGLALGWLFLFLRLFLLPA